MKTAILFVLTTIGALSINAQQWQKLGNSSQLVNHSSNYGVGIANIGFNKQGNPLASGSVTDNSGVFNFASWNGTIWNQLTPPSNIGTVGCDYGAICCMTIDTAFNIYAPLNQSNSFGIVKYDGTNWTTIPRSYQTPIRNMKSDKLGNIYITSLYGNYNTPNVVSKWTGTSWVDTDTIPNIPYTNTGSIIEQFAVDSAGVIYAIGHFYDTTNNVYVAKWNGIQWLPVGNLAAVYPVQKNNWNGTKKITTDANGNVYISILEADVTGNNLIASHIAKWNGSNWAVLGGIADTTFNSQSGVSKMVADKSGNLYVSHLKSIFKWNNTNWQRLGFGTDSLLKYGLGDIAIDKYDNLYVGANEDNTYKNFFVAKLVNPILPLALINFSVLNINSSSNMLSFSTTNEVNVSHINIQRSANGKEFRTIRKINASCCKYSFVDDLKTKDQNLKTLYYKLEIVDKDGSKQYSEVRTLSINNYQLSINVFPNPSRDVVSLQINQFAGNGTIVVTDLFGKQIKTQVLILGTNTIDVSSFAKGMYFVSVITNDGKKTEKLIVE